MSGTSWTRWRMFRLPVASQLVPWCSALTSARQTFRDSPADTTPTVRFARHPLFDRHLVALVNERLVMPVRTFELPSMMASFTYLSDAQAVKLGVRWHIVIDPARCELLIANMWAKAAAFVIRVYDFNFQFVRQFKLPKIVDTVDTTYDAICSMCLDVKQSHLLLLEWVNGRVYVMCKLTGVIAKIIQFDSERNFRSIVCHPTTGNVFVNSSRGIWCYRQQDVEAAECKSPLWQLYVDRAWGDIREIRVDVPSDMLCLLLEPGKLQMVKCDDGIPLTSLELPHVVQSTVVHPHTGHRLMVHPAIGMTIVDPAISAMLHVTDPHQPGASTASTIRTSSASNSSAFRPSHIAMHEPSGFLFLIQTQPDRLHVLGWPRASNT